MVAERNRNGKNRNVEWDIKRGKRMSLDIAIQNVGVFYF